MTSRTRRCFNPWRVFSWLATCKNLGLHKRLVKFQSLAGFFVACNSSGRTWTLNESSFNPWRVFSWLATQIWGAVPASRLGSFNPWRVFSWLATLRKNMAGAGVSSFNPWRVFSWLATRLPGRPYHHRMGQVSIPGGFFRGLQPRSCNTCSTLERSFNPWRVFSWLATLQAGRRSRPDQQSFNPWRVFSWLATVFEPSSKRAGQSFNPWRVFSWLAT